MNITGDRIKELRIRNGWTQEELGDRLGVKKAAINKYESGIVENIKRQTLIELANILDTTPNYLMGWDEETAQSIRDISVKKLREKSGSGSLVNALNASIGYSNVERILIESYRNLDEKGRHTIDVVMKMESDRYQEEKLNKKSNISILNAAHAIPGASEEDKQHDEDIMDDENF